MPELPEVETIVRGLREDVVGRTFANISLCWPRQIITPSPDEFVSNLSGQCVLTLDRRGKYIVFRLTRNVLLIHLKMTGRLYIAQAGMENVNTDLWKRVIFAFDDGYHLIFSDARKFGRLYLVEQMDDITGKLGPEPLFDDFTPDVLRMSLAKRRVTIKSLLLDQHIVAGIGNIYADESLWEAKIDPRRKADTLNSEEIQHLHTAIQLVLQRGIDYEGASINWYRKPDGNPGNSQYHLRVYNRDGEACIRCGTRLTKIRLSQRGTHFCPKCQL